MPLSLAIGAMMLLSPSASDQLVVAISLDIPPYVMDGADRGLEVDLMRAAFPGHDVRFMQLPYSELENAVEEGRADVSIGVQQQDDGVYYSDNVVVFVNHAITRQEDAITINAVSDLAGHPVLTWEGAVHELGEPFEQLFAPGSPHHADYIEVADQREQVELFWNTPGQVAVIDASIFRHFTNAMGHDLGDAVFHDIFPPVTRFKVAFKDKEVRDAFSARFAALCLDGTYGSMLDRYDVEEGMVIVEREHVRVAADQYFAALNAMFTGDMAPMTRVWSHADDVFYRGPAGGTHFGWDKVRDAWQRQADMHLGGSIAATDMAIVMDGELAAAVTRGVGENIIGGAKQAVTVRNTIVFRKEQGAWKAIGSHVDPVEGIK